MVDHEQKIFLLEKILTYIEVDLASRSFGPVELITYIVTETVKQ